MKTTFSIIIATVVLLAICFPGATPAFPDRAPSGSLIAQGGPDLALDSILIRKIKDKINLRVRVMNIGNMAAQNLGGNLTVYLRVQDPDTGQWRELQQWSNIDSIKPDQEVARDYLPVKEYDPAVLGSKFVLQAEIRLASPGNIRISRATVENEYPEDAVVNP